MKLNKILIPTISLIGLTSIIPTVACTKSKEEKDSFPFELDTDITDIKVDENYDTYDYVASDHTVCLYYPDLNPIKISYKNGKKFKATDRVSVWLNTREFNFETVSGNYELRSGYLVVPSITFQSDGTYQFIAYPYVTHEGEEGEVPDDGEETTWSFTFQLEIDVNNKEYILKNYGQISGHVAEKTSTKE